MIDRIEAGEIQLKRPRSFVGTAWSRGNVRAALAVRCGERKAARQVQRGTELVSTDQIVDEAVGSGQKPAAFPERQVVGAVELELLFTQVVVAPVVHLAIDLLIVTSCVESALPCVARSELQTVGEPLFKGGLKSVVVGVKAIVVIGQILRPTARRVERSQVLSIAGNTVSWGRWTGWVPAEGFPSSGHPAWEAGRYLVGICGLSVA